MTSPPLPSHLGHEGEGQGACKRRLRQKGAQEETGKGETGHGAEFDLLFQGLQAQASPTSPGPRAGRRAAHTPRARTHTHTALLDFFFFLSKKIKIYCPLKKKKIHPALGNCDTD